MVQNKIEDINNGKENVDNEILKKHNVIYDCQISLKEAFLQKDSGSRFDLSAKIFKLELSQIIERAAKSIEIQVYIANIRDKIRNLNDNNVWTWKEYENFCIENAEADINTNQLEILTRYLHDTGVILYYGYIASMKNTILKDTIFINPNYVTNTIYEILDYKVQQQEGKFTKQYVENKLGNDETAEVFISLMKSPNFELIFEYPENPNTFYAVQYLPDIIKHKKLFENIVFGYEDIALVIHFKKYFSITIIYRFIARYGWFADIYEPFWKYGIVFIKNKVKVFVECKFSENKILIKTSSVNKSNLLIREILDTFIELSDNDQDIELSLDNNDFDSLVNIEKYQLTKYKFNNNITNNYIKVKGDGNVILQNVNGKNITINYKDDESFLNIISEFKQNQKEENQHIGLEIAKFYVKLQNILVTEKDTKSVVKELQREAIIVNQNLYELNKNIVSGFSKLTDKINQVSENIELLKQGQTQIISLQENSQKIIEELKRNSIDINRLDEITENINKQSSERIDKTGLEIAEHINYAFEKYENKFDENMSNIYKQINKPSSNWETKIKISVPLLNLIGVKIEHEVKLTKFIKWIHNTF